MRERPDEERSVLARVRVTNPLAGCAYALQRKDGVVDQVQMATDGDLVFTTSITLRLTAEETHDPRGLHVHGPRGGRFLYVTSGSLAGQRDSCWTRRAKVSLRGIETAVPRALEAMPPMIEATIAGRARDNGPACATVPLLSTWTHAL